jgi:RNA polymerase sigma-70 factor (ECF subfamily)
MGGSDAVALEEAPAPDQEAFAALVQRHSHALFRLAYRMTGNEADAEEVVQETFLRAYRRLHQFEARAQVKSWLYSIAINCARDFLQKHRRRDRFSQPLDLESPAVARAAVGGQPLPDRMAQGVEMQAHLNRALRHLTPKERAALMLRHFEGLSIAEIGRSLGLRPSATKNCIFRAVRKLRRALGPLAAESP